MNHKDEPAPRPAGTLSDFVQWRVNDASWTISGLWISIPPASLIGAVIGVVSGRFLAALLVLMLGVVTLVWMFVPLLTKRYELRGSDESDATAEASDAEPDR